MPTIRVSPRFAFLVVLVLAGITACTAVQPAATQYPPAGYVPPDPVTKNNWEKFCMNGNGSKGRPLICIDENTLQPHPDPALSWDVEAKNGHPTHERVVVHWFTQKSANLKITFKKAGCVGRIRCDGRGHCWATVKPLDVDALRQKTIRKCKYNVEIDGQKLDPELEINPCCW